MAAPVIDHNLLTLDYWQDSVTYEGKTVPSGTIGCEVLNIPDTLREKLAQASIPLQKIVAAIKENTLTAELLRPAKGSVLHMIQLAADMKDNRNEMIPAQFVDWTWDLTGYAAKVLFYNAEDLTMREVRSVFQLDPEPPQMELNDYIREAVRKRDLSCFSFFLHHFEKRLNGVIYRFLTRNGYDRYDPARFLDYKLEVLQMLIYCLPKFDPEQKTEFLKYAKHYIRDGLLFCRMIGEAGSFASLAEYRRVRQIGAMYNNSGKSRAEVVSEFAAQSGYKDENGSADELLTIAQRNRSIVSLYRTEQDEDGEETGEDVTHDDSWNYADILWNGIQAKAVAAAFEQLSYKEQWNPEKRNAICMTCGRVSPLSAQSTFRTWRWISRVRQPAVRSGSTGGRLTSCA